MNEWILVIDDDPVILRMASSALEGQGMRASCVLSGQNALKLLTKRDALPDLILLDIHMPEMDGFETLARIQESPSAKSVPVVFLTGDDDAGAETKGLEAGAMDFIKKPFVAQVLVTRVRHIIELTRLQNDLAAQVVEQTKAVREEQERVSRMHLQLVHALAGAVDAKDAYTNGHSERVASYAREIARHAGYDEEQCDKIYLMGLLHDVGKIGVPGVILNKAGALTDEEFATIKTHPVQGDRILKNISEFPELAIGARWHHERYDGNGYPDGIAGSAIPEEVRILSVADAYDAMTSRRSYRDVMPQEKARSEIVRCRGTQFDPRYADIMLELIDADVNYEMREH